MICFRRTAPSVAIAPVDLQEREEAACPVLKHLGKLKRPYLTVVEENLVSVIEKEYGIIDEIPQNSQSTKD